MQVRKRRNHWSYVDWDQRPWELLSRGKKRERLLKEANYACTKCGYNTCRPDGKTILEIDHIDGNHKNNAKDNLQVLCPNCHALTPNFRNWGRPGHTKTGTRLRVGNKGYDETMRLIREQQRAFVEEFKAMVLETHASGEIDYGKFGWVQRLADKRRESPQVVGKRVRRLLPEFFAQHCFTRSQSRLIAA